MAIFNIRMNSKHLELSIRAVCRNYIKHLTYMLNLFKLADCLISFGFRFHSFRSRNLRVFDTSTINIDEVLFYYEPLDLILLICTIIWLSNFLSKVLVFSFRNRLKHFSQNKITINFFNFDKFRSHLKMFCL